MDTINAVAKARFSSARVQQVRLHAGGREIVELLCFEPGQKLSVAAGRRMYYVIAGAGEIVAGSSRQSLAAGHLAVTAPDERHTVGNSGEQRLVCLVVGRTS